MIIKWGLNKMAGDNYEVIFGPLEALHNDFSQLYCPGCEHGMLTRLIAKAISDLGLKQKTIGVASVGCSVRAYQYYNVDYIQAMHGRAPAVCTGIKRALPDRIVYTVQGDGDALAIGLGETISAAIRGEPISVFLVNNAIYGMTGGQMAPTTHDGMWTSTTPTGRDVEKTGQPTMICEMLKEIANATYVQRVSAIINKKTGKKGTRWSAKNVINTYRAIENAFKVQQIGGYAFVEILTTCAVNWKMSVKDAKLWGATYHVKNFPPALFRDDFKVEAKLKPMVETPENSLAFKHYKKGGQC
jgi:2-oxoglutarate ferredoxin oxidoreductase subunit beta